MNRRQINFLGALACATMMAVALFAQFGLHLQPCNMCILQRICVVSLGLVFLAAALQDPGTAGARVYAVGIAAAALAGVAVSGRHIWMSMQPLGSLPSCGADFYSMVQMIPITDVVAKIWNGGGECQMVPWRLLGLSMQTWVLIGAAALGSAGVAANVALPRVAAARAAI
jgi:disulfide bond formation protein DsbB